MGIDLPQIASIFCPDLEVLSVQELGQGNINDTYLVETKEERFVLQRINRSVFAEPEQVVANIDKVTSHFISATDHRVKRYQNTFLLRTGNQDLFYRDHENQIWRCLSFIENSYSCDFLRSAAQGYEVGWALGCFHQMAASLDPGCLYATIPGFHTLPSYLITYDRILPAKTKTDSPEAHYCQQCISTYRSEAHILERCRKTGQLETGVIHGDPKVSNVLFDSRSDLAVSLIDLDTVGPGLLHYDLGDCLRSCCNINGEESNLSGTIRFDTDICQEVLAGYFSEAGSLLRNDQKQLIYEAARLITFELGLRFFSDYLIGNRYFKVNDEDDNLRRAVNQFHLMESIISQERSIRLLLG